MTSADNVVEQVGAPRHAARRPADDAEAGRLPLEGLAQWAMRVPWCWPALLTLALGFYQVSRPELWRDELASWSLATRPVPDLIATARHTDATEIAYYLLLHYWIAAFGDSVGAMRALSVLAMAGAAACVTLVGRRLSGAWAGLLAGLVFALAPSVSRFAQEVRSYALGVLVATLATLLLLRAFDKPTVRRWAAYGVCLAVLGYIDIVALSVVAGHAAGVAMRWWRDRDSRLLGFVPAAVVGLAACLPLAVIGSGQAAGQVFWILRPGLSLTVFAFFGRNLTYSTGFAAALFVLAVLAWAVDRWAAAFATALAVLPVVAVWLVSQGPHAYFFPRYMLFTVGAWAILAGIALSKIDMRVAAAAVLAIAVLGAGDQQVVRAPGAHNWPYYPVNSGVRYWDYAGAATILAREAKRGDGIVYPTAVNRWLLIGPGIGYYLKRDLRPGVPAPRELFIAKTAAQAGSLFPVQCANPAACVDNYPRRVWVVAGGNYPVPVDALTPGDAAVLLPKYGPVPEHMWHVKGMTLFLLVRM
jgi:mannosyltransferase